MAAAARKTPLISRIKEFVPVGETRALKDVAMGLRVSQKAVEEEVDGCYDGVCLNVGIRVGGASASLPRRDWEVEHYQA
jgi:hypothetical protein